MNSRTKTNFDPNTNASIGLIYREAYSRLHPDLTTASDPSLSHKYTTDDESEHTRITGSCSIDSFTRFTEQKSIRGLK